ncbi:MAG TPA: glycosyltransferase [Candidatus Acidoferrales bacterium]|jgi:glycosyltransferase involved in cell wall biosynthesis|nr:glycosyltransferase [Candidatus Acidoferrales bacterium]
MKILLSTYSCFPCQTSEPGNAWRSINEALREHEVWAVIADAHRYREITEPWLAKNPLPNFHPVWVRLNPALQALGRLAAANAVYYHLWQEHLCGVARELQQRIKFDLVHHVTYGRYWSPSGLRDLNLPFIWGPVGAAETPPRSFVRELPWRCRVIEAARDHARSFCEGTSALRNTACAATIALGVTRESCEALERLGARRVERMPQMALTEADLAQFAALPAPPAGPLRAICVGRHVYWKGFYLAIRAFAEFAKKSRDAELWIVNDGPFRRELEKTAAQTGVAASVKFLGTLPKYSDVLARLGQSHVLLHPALHEGFGNVCLEAMAAGRPVGCLDIGGPASQITPETGFAAPATNPLEAVTALAGFLERIDRDRALLAAMSAAARAHVQSHFTMRKINERMRTLYSEAVGLHRLHVNKRPVENHLHPG